MNDNEPAWVTDVLRFWFEELAELDWFARNDADADARNLARGIVAQGFDRAMTPRERLFVYLPFEHSENAGDQALAVHLIESLGNEYWTRYALAHQIAIARCGRFPLRNAALGRVSTADEIAYMSEAAQG